MVEGTPCSRRIRTRPQNVMGRACHSVQLSLLVFGFHPDIDSSRRRIPGLFFFRLLPALVKFELVSGSAPSAPLSTTGEEGRTVAAAFTFGCVVGDGRALGRSAEGGGRALRTRRIRMCRRGSTCTRMKPIRMCRRGWACTRTKRIRMCCRGST